MILASGTQFPVLVSHGLFIELFADWVDNYCIIGYIYSWMFFRRLSDKRPRRNPRRFRSTDTMPSSTRARINESQTKISTRFDHFQISERSSLRTD